MKAYRGTVRLSLNGDAGSNLRNKLASIAFVPHGFVNSSGAKRTGMWSRFPRTEVQMAECMIAVWDTLKAYRGKARLDNYWCSFEEVDFSLKGIRTVSPAVEFDQEIANLGFVRKT